MAQLRLSRASHGHQARSVPRRSVLRKSLELWTPVRRRLSRLASSRRTDWRSRSLGVLPDRKVAARRPLAARGWAASLVPATSPRQADCPAIRHVLLTRVFVLTVLPCSLWDRWSLARSCSLAAGLRLRGPAVMCASQARASFECLPTDGCHREQPATAWCSVGLTGCGIAPHPRRGQLVLRTV